LLPSNELLIFVSQYKFPNATIKSCFQMITYNRFIVFTYFLTLTLMASCLWLISCRYISHVDIYHHVDIYQRERFIIKLWKKRWREITLKTSTMTLYDVGLLLNKKNKYTCPMCLIEGLYPNTIQCSLCWIG
jgi:hypothetical protein